MNTNHARAERAYCTVVAYPSDEPGNFEATLRDLLTDLRHLCDEQGEDFEAAARMAAIHYEAEAEGA